MNRSLLACSLCCALLVSCASPENLDGPPPAPSVPEPPSVQLSDDDEIEDRVLSALNRQPMGNADITLTSFNGIVLFTGQVLSESARDEATSAAAFSGANISRIVNELRVVDRITEDDEEAEQALAERVSAAMRQAGANAERVHVVVDRGTAYLILMMSQEEARPAVEAAANTPGVEEVRTIVQGS